MKRNNLLIILIILIVFSILILFLNVASFGPDRLLPNKCILTSGLSCDDIKVTSSGIMIKITNSLGYELHSIKLSFEKCTDEDGIAAGPKELPNGGSSTYTMECNLPIRGPKLTTKLHLYATSAIENVSVSGVIIQIIEDPILSIWDRWDRLKIRFINIITFSFLYDR